MDASPTEPSRCPSLVGFLKAKGSPSPGELSWLRDQGKLEPSAQGEHVNQTEMNKQSALAEGTVCVKAQWQGQKGQCGQRDKTKRDEREMRRRRSVRTAHLQRPKQVK